MKSNENGTFTRFQKKVASGMDWFIKKAYEPSLKSAVKWRLTVVAIFIATAVIMAGIWSSGK